jgi:N-acylglucosamine 2-epimerase
MKLWWVHNEMLIATLVAHFITGDEKYEAWYDKVHDYSFSHFSDKEYGEWYGYLHRDGTVSHTQKGSLWKGPYHLLRCLILCEQILVAAERGESLPELL